MSLRNSPKIVTNGLVFAYDAENPKSYKGPTLTNLLSSTISPYTTSGTGYDFIGGSEEVYIPTIGRTTATFCKIQNNYSAVSTWCCPAPFGFGGGYAVSPSTLYTYLILYKVNSGYTNANYMYRYEYNSGSYVTESGVHSEARRVHLGDGWYYAWGTFTTNASTNTLSSCAAFYYRYSTSYDKMWVAKTCIVQGDYSGMHPRYWPNGGTTRSNTQALVDLTGNNTITANSLTYNSDGSFSFSSAVSNYLSIPVNSTLNMPSTFTLEAWVNPISVTDDRAIIILGQGSYYLTIDSGLKLSVYCYGKSPSGYHTDPTALISGQWCQICAVWDSTQVNLYVNGSIRTSVATTGTPNSVTTQVIMGSEGNGSTRKLNGSIAATKIYSRALTSDEVKQNFNALRGRYGI